MLYDENGSNFRRKYIMQIVVIVGNKYVIISNNYE